MATPAAERRHLAAPATVVIVAAVVLLAAAYVPLSIASEPGCGAHLTGTIAIRPSISVT